ncbi:hypothetical protein MMC14_000248 [Varicellaria rhodocarpa]|nr:hypothetical protein [Varicellaria rhodocarpa]
MASRTSSIHTVPNEILTMIFTNLEPLDLKSVRLVCQLWSTVGIAKLFECIYISYRLKDLDVFRQISSHPLYRKAVKRLYLDPSVTSTAATKEIWRYSNKLNRQSLDIALSSSVRTRPPSGPGSSLSNFLKFRALMKITHQTDFRHFPLFPHNVAEGDLAQLDEIIKGFDAYKALAKEERSVIESGQFRETLIWGLRELSNLAEVFLSGRQDYRGPFRRSWPLTYLFPEDEEADTRAVNMYHFSHVALVRGLLTSGRRISEFITNEPERFGIRLQLFDLNATADRKDITSVFYNFYSGLRVLSLVIDTAFYKWVFNQRLEWASLQLSDLTDLALAVKWEGEWDPRKMAPFDIFAKWSHPKLRRLLLQHVRISEKQLLAVLKTHHSLRSLWIGPFVEHNDNEDGGHYLSLPVSVDLTQDVVVESMPRHQRGHLHFRMSGTIDDYNRKYDDGRVEELKDDLENFLYGGGFDPLRFQISPCKA